MRVKENILLGGYKPPSKYEALKSKNYSVVIFTPTRDGKCSHSYAISLAHTCLVLEAANIAVTIGRSTNSCFVDLSRNLFANEFLSSKHTHMLQIDDDMDWNPEAVLDLFLFDKEFVAGVGRKKTDDIDFAGVYLEDDNGAPIGQLGRTQEETLLKMKYIGGAFTLHKRSVFEKLMTPEDHTKTGYKFYECRYYFNGWRSEDYVFCEKCTDKGIDIWCYPNIEMGHLGNKNYSGNYFKFLKERGEKQGVSKGSGLTPDQMLQRSIDRISKAIEESPIKVEGGINV